jgi:hypothetical protein
MYSAKNLIFKKKSDYILLLHKGIARPWIDRDRMEPPEVIDALFTPTVLGEVILGCGEALCGVVKARIRHFIAFYRLFMHLDRVQPLNDLTEAQIIQADEILSTCLPQSESLMFWILYGWTEAFEKYRSHPVALLSHLVPPNYLIGTSRRNTNSSARKRFADIHARQTKQAKSALEKVEARKVWVAQVYPGL